jgi:hypothetical protein
MLSKSFGVCASPCLGHEPKSRVMAKLIALTILKYVSSQMKKK